VGLSVSGEWSSYSLSGIENDLSVFLSESPVERRPLAGFSGVSGISAEVVIFY
jgi:hypothetical protein